MEFNSTLTCVAYPAKQQTDFFKQTLNPSSAFKAIKKPYLNLNLNSGIILKITDSFANYLTASFTPKKYDILSMRFSTIVSDRQSELRFKLVEVDGSCNMKGALYAL